ncbi:double-strand break repair helicase AddA [Caulobacter mirabilis]|uniref:DNA 3'-5' helicase n=1 Tax=Caulobacter mirabilis TaxID=69666 RepID=A0A2D2B3C5_9CAUL|nr:double-strand break repair helicase AddA [Caulobacter mirabilis]ATQ44765.1 double-strand break repair helicase AddA [Caulobacter mirabilis]
MSGHDLLQRRAADPSLNAFVTANAGSGKTKTLIDRVARLLLREVPPAAILCVTYTKAAAAEMQHRLFEKLGGWSVLEDSELKKALAELDGGEAEQMDALALSRARTLFAKALETPGGLKIQTIHAFCEKLLRRFPLEARVSPGFTVMDDAAAALIASEARAAVAHHALQSDGPVARAYARLATALDFDSFQQMFDAFEQRRDAIAGYVQRCGGFEGVAADVWTVCGFDEATDAEAVSADIAAGVDGRLYREAADVLAQGGKTDIKCAGLLRAAAGGDLGVALTAFFTAGGEGTPATWVAKTSGLKSREDLRMALLAEQDRLDKARERLRAARVAETSALVLALASAYAIAYDQAKAGRGALDFADLILRTKGLVAERPDAAWVLYKLDDGIDHVLVDEAQDTAPEQWEIVRQLTGEFWSGAGLRGVDATDRTLFVVGDEKQSIYSFQGADPERLLTETQRYIAEITAVGKPADGVPLLVSYRSTPQVLSFVDALFTASDTRAGVPPPSGEDVVSHRAFRADHPGCVDLWPLEREDKGEDRDAWDAPLDEEAETSANRRLARQIAAEIEGLVKRGDAVFDKETRQWRPADYGDVLILVRRRRVLFEEIIRALKRAGVPVAGADRLTLSAHIAFDDLLALARFVLFPDDDLTLAALLKSPFCGLGDEDVYALARTRKPETLWAVLHRRASERPAWAAALALLETARSLARRHTPFDFYARMIGLTDDAGRSMRARFLTRLGGEAGDVLDEFLARALAAEAQGIRDLETLAAAFVGLNISVKREMEAAAGEVRVMTTHGAKGLEAPIVFLPETTVTRTARGSPLLETESGGFLWCAKAADDCAASAAAREHRRTREEGEAWRLLYVALTRARDRLVLCGRIDARTSDEKVGGWYAAMRDAFAHPTIEPGVRTVAGVGGAEVRRFGPDPATLPARAEPSRAAAAAPTWLGTPPPPEPAARRYASPSQLAEQAPIPAPSPLARVGGLGRFRRGDLIHRLLQLLPDVPPAERREAAAALLGREPDVVDHQRQEMIAAAFGVLEDPVFAEVFGPGSRAEAGIAGSSPRLPPALAVSGRVDRLLVTPERVLVVDYKTNRPAPATLEAADPAYRIQMAVYAAVLAEIFPGRRIDAALVWTDGPRLMPVPENIMTRTLVELSEAH